MRKTWYKYREVIIVLACLCVLMIIGLWLLEVFINQYPFISLTVCLIVLAFLAARKKLIK